MQSLSLLTHPDRLAICSLPADAPLPAWALTGRFFSVTRTPRELSVVCGEADVPASVPHAGPWLALEVEGVLDFTLTGILAGLSTPLAEAGISLFALSTYRTDYILVPAQKCTRAQEVLRRAGHAVR